jgi:hypothetical protein
MFNTMFNSMSVTKTLRLTTAAIAWAAVLVQLVYSIRNGVARGESVARALADYLAYFTILTNLLVALVLTVPLVAPQSAVARFFAHLHVTWTAAAAILVVGLAYHFLLSSIHHPVGMEVVTNLGLHYLVPPLYAVYWVMSTDVTGAPLAPRALHLSAYPTAYFAMVVGRGEVVGVYPYFFVDVSTLGLMGAFRNACGILVFYLAVAWILRVIATRVRPRLA